MVNNSGGAAAEDHAMWRQLSSSLWLRRTSRQLRLAHWWLSLGSCRREPRIGQPPIRISGGFEPALFESIRDARVDVGHPLAWHRKCADKAHTTETVSQS